jgi:hypothetical protein
VEWRLDPRPFLKNNRKHIFAIALSAGLSVLILRPILFRAGLPAYQHDWSWPFDAQSVLSGALNHFSTWSPAGLGTPNALASSNILHLIIALPALFVSGITAAKLTLLACVAFAAVAAYFMAVRVMSARTVGAVASAILYITLPVVVNKIAAGHVTYWIAYALQPLLLERSVTYARTRSTKVLAHIALLTAGCSMQIQFAAFAPLVVLAGGTCGDWRSAGKACIASLVGGVIAVGPTAYAFWTAKAYIAELYLPPKIIWENGVSASLPDALWMTKYVVPYYEATGWWYDLPLKAEIVFAILLGLIVPGRNRVMVLTLAIFGLFFTTGTLGPVAVFWRYAFTHWPAAGVFRDAYDANAMLALAYALALASSSRWRVVSILALAAAFAAALPLLIGSIDGAVANVTLPNRALEQRFLHEFPAGRVAATPFDAPMLLDKREPGGIDIGAPADSEHQSLAEYPTLFPLDEFSLSRCYCEPWFEQAMRRASVSGVIIRPNLESADLTRQHYVIRSPALTIRTIANPLPLVGFAARAISQPLSFEKLYGPRTVGLAAPIGPLPATRTAAEVTVPQADRVRDDPRTTWVSIARWYAYALNHPAIANGITTLSREPKTIVLGKGPWFVLYSSQRRVRVVARSISLVLPARPAPTWAALPGGAVTLIPRGGVCTIFRIARGDTTLPLGTYARTSIESEKRPWPWRVDVHLAEAIHGPRLLIFRERFSTGWRISGATVLWHGVADGYANAFLVAAARRNISLVYSPQKIFLLLTAAAWLLQTALIVIALPAWRFHER